MECAISMIIFSFYDFPKSFKDEYRFCGEKKAIMNLSIALAKCTQTYYVSLGNSCQFELCAVDNLNIVKLPRKRPIGLLDPKVLRLLESIKHSPVITNCSGVLSHIYIRRFLCPSRVIYVSYGLLNEYAVKDVVSSKNKILVLAKGHLQSRLTLRLNDVVVSLTSDESDKLRKYVSPNRIALIHHGVDVDRYKPRNEHSYEQRLNISRKYGIDTNRFTVLATGRISYENNFHGAIKAFARLAKEHKEAVQLVIAGTTWDFGSGTGIEPEYYASYIRSLASKYGIPNSVRIVKNIPEYELPLIYCLSDVFIQFTDGYSPLPNVILEAAASGLPLVLTYHPAREHILQDGRNGFFISREGPRKNPDKVAGILDYMKDIEKERRSMGIKSRKMVEEHFDITRIAKKYNDTLGGFGS